MYNTLQVHLTRQSTDYSQRLPQGWKKKLSDIKALWVGQALFSGKGKLCAQLQLWYHPPEAKSMIINAPRPGNYHQRRIFLWMPRKMWAIEFKCPKCIGQCLRSKGAYNNLRVVLDISSKYMLAGEYMDCRNCKGTYISWDGRILAQLPAGKRQLFPVLLTRKYACDRSIIQYPTSDMISDVRYRYPTSDMISDVLYRYPTSDIDIRHPIYYIRRLI